MACLPFARTRRRRACTMSDATSSQLPSPPFARSLDVDALETSMRQRGQDLTEAKEAVVDALLCLTVQKCTGDGPEGKFIYSAKPSGKLVSGFLMPRFDASG